MLSQKLLLSHAKQLRTCPPLAVRENPLYKDEVELHLKKCPLCSDIDTDKMKASEKLVQGIKKVLKKHYPDQESLPVKPGQFRYIRHQPDAWHKGYFYNPPLVLVLKIRSEISESILAAQTYHEPLLAGPGDLIITDNQSGRGDLFIEPWNTYKLRAKDLGECVGKVSDEIIKAVLLLEKNPDNLPQWGILTMPFTENDPRLYFREIETETGYIFSSRAAAKHMHQLKNQKPAIRCSSIDELKRVIQNQCADAYWNEEPVSIEECITSYKILKQAADDRQKHFNMNLISLINGEINTIESVPATILDIKYDENKLFIECRIEKIPEQIENFQLTGLIKTKTNQKINSEYSLFDLSTGFFILEFVTDEKKAKQVMAALIYEKKDNSD